MNRGLIIFIVILVLVIGVPILAGLKNQFLPTSTPSAPTTSKSNQQTTASNLEPNPNKLVPPPTQEAIPQVQYQVPQIPQGPPDFTGTMWSVPTPYGMVQVSLNPGGQAVASHPMVGNITGNWRVQGNKIVATVSFMGQTQTVAADICGNTLCYNGQPLQRLR
ncbi:MAG TPA: hypothetical protein PLT82_07345 [Candidatus Hydrogenedens sp.]|nr:hypothetical protein [Candidatus Hydrogenedens sp.]HOL19243.1 hypothetical protein [Candidatus Hydrogenedens sp.]HPP58930.1 hypothetical protein [Candidatus Hydrogenedens sp.]